MKKWLPIFLICLITFISLTPKVGIFAYTQNDYYEAIGSYFLADMLISGDANEIDFSIGSDSTQFLIDFGEALVSGDYTGLIDYGLEQIENTITDLDAKIRDAIYAIDPYIYSFLEADAYVAIKPSYGTLTRHLLNNLSNQPTPTPQPTPDTNYEFISNINEIICSRDGHNSNFFETTQYFDLWGGNIVDSSTYFKRDYTYTSNLLYHVNLNSGEHQNQIAILSPVMSIYVTRSNNNVNVVYSSSSSLTYNGLFNMISNPNQQYSLNNARSVNFYYDSSRLSKPSLSDAFTNYPTSYTRTNFDSFDVCINYIYQHYANINLYVDGIPWALVSNNDNTVPITIPDTLTILNDYPAKYYYNQPVYFDMGDLVTKIRNAINTSNVLTYSDIEDLIVDVNGQPAVAVVNFARTDYDVLASEQIPYYPKFYYDVNLNQYAQAGAQIVNISTEVLPRDVLNIIITCGVILLFGYVVRRLLE